MLRRDWKDLLLSVLVAYIVTDLMLHYTMKNAAPSCAEKVLNYFNSEAGMIAVAIGVIVGLVVWFLSRRSKECYQNDTK